jgi:RimJ/RimL family protein N-acetyltransferase
MTQHQNALGHPVGFPLPGWKPPPAPPREPMDGRYCRLEPLHAEAHARALHDANARDAEGGMWTYMAYGPFENFAAYQTWVVDNGATRDPLFFAIVDKATGSAVGVASYMRIDPRNGVIEVGGLAFSPLLQKKPAATEAMFLMMQQAFALGYRRYEWKCDSLNAPSRAAAQRYGFSYEGIFRQAVVYKARNRDTAWFSILDSEWPAIRDAFTKWLAPANFDAQGRQRESLSALTAPLLKARG